MAVPIFEAVVEKNKIKLRDPQAFGLWVSQFDKKIVQVIVRKFQKPRSTGKPYEEGNQNGYIWGVMFKVLGDYMGYTPEELYHEVLLPEYGPIRWETKRGKQVARRPSMSKWTTDEATQFIDTVIRIAAEMDCVIPPPVKVEA